MFAMFSRQSARPRAALPDLTSIAEFIARWFSLSARRAATHSLHLLESVPLTAQASVSLVRFGSETLVLGVTSQTITVLAKGSATDATAGQQWTIESCAQAATAGESNLTRSPIS
jgi:flagellar biogenesis protein FliO